MRRLLVAIGLCFAAVPAMLPLTETVAAAEPAPFVAAGSVAQVYAYDLGATTAVELLDGSGAVLDSGTSDVAGAYLFRNVAAGSGYQVRTAAGTVSGLTVTTADAHPSGAFYDDLVAQNPMAEGYGYMPTRDGTTLSVNVTFPSDGSTGPWPVVVNYSGYDPSQPGGPTREVAFYPFQGYVVVGVNMRGTGCSGGTFEFMEDLQATDGYDLIENVARQSWSNGHVGMAGISYSGYSQLYVGATNPPHLDAIAPASPYSDTYSGILYPGGILNDGFAVEWATDRENGAKPRARAWVRTRINGGDTTCDRNQLLRLQAKPLLERIEETPYADHEFDYLNTETFVGQIRMPTFLSSQWQDEQTGGSAANLIPLFDPATKVYGNFTNGTHVEPMSPSEIYEQMVFMDLYVGKRVPRTSPVLTVALGTVLADIFRAGDQSAAFKLPTNTWSDLGTYPRALAHYESRGRIRVRWENGAVSGKEGLPIASVTTRHDSWPIAGITDEKLYLQPDGALSGTPSTVPDAAARASSSYTYDPSTKRRSTSTQGTEEVWAAHPDYQWDVLDEGNSLSFVTAPYGTRTAYAGQGSVDLWIRSSEADTDLEATLTEVRPDGQEVYIQSGWLRASHRLEDPARSTELVPYHDHQEADASPLPAGEFTKVRIEVFPFAHVIRPGSRLRVNIEAPGGNQPFWKFETLGGTATNEIGHSVGWPSRIVLPRLPAAASPNVAATLPACSLAGVTTQAVSLRNQPCRTYAPARVPTAVQAILNDDGSTDVRWKAPAGPAPDQYRVIPSTGSPVLVAGSVRTAAFAATEPVETLEYRVEAIYGGVASPVSDASLPAAPLPVALRLFGEWPPFVARQLRDFTGSVPAADWLLGVAMLDGGTSAPDYLAALRNGRDASTNVDPVTRLYLAYFGRTPDASGQTYWSGKRRSGTSLRRISSTFEQSAEFRATYGSLTDREFVELVYRNILDREGDPSGVTFWTTQLDQGKRTRGQVMVGFSESVEYQAATADRVDATNLYLAMLRRPPTDDELGTAIVRLASADSLADLAGELLASEEYAQLVGA